MIAKFLGENVCMQEYVQLDYCAHLRLPAKENIWHNEETENWEGGKFVFCRRRRMRPEKKEGDYLLQQDIIAKLDKKQTNKKRQIIPSGKADISNCSSQPSMVNWLSSSIFPCSLFSRYGDPVTPVTLLIMQ